MNSPSRTAKASSHVEAPQRTHPRVNSAIVRRPRRRAPPRCRSPSDAPTASGPAGAMAEGLPRELLEDPGGAGATATARCARGVWARGEGGVGAGGEVR